MTSNSVKFDESHINNDAPHKVLIFTEHVNATYYISFHFALQEYAKSGNVSFATLSQNAVKEQLTGTVEKFATSILSDFKPDLVIFTRYALPYGPDLLNAFKALGLPTVYHLDDNLLEIPDSLGQDLKKLHGAEEVIEAREKQITAADIVYPSTETLSEILTERYDNLKIYRGMYAPSFEFLIDKTVEKRENPKLTIGYMGSKGHKQDLALVVPAITQILKENPNIRFETFGTITMPEELEEFESQIASHAVNKNYQQFLQYLYELNWDIGLAPLESQRFNSCKAPTKFIEYSACDLAIIASDYPVYSREIDGTSGILAKDHEWYQAISKMIQSEQTRSNVIKNAKSYCNKTYPLDRLIEQLIELIKLTGSIKD